MGACDGEDAATGVNADLGLGAFGFEEGEDLPGAVVAEQLAVFPFVPLNAVLFDEGKEVGRGVAGEGGLWKMGAAVGDVVGGGGAEIGEIAAAATGDEDLVPGARLVFEHGDGTTEVASGLGTKKPGGTAAEHEDVEVVGHLRITGNQGSSFQFT